MNWFLSHTKNLHWTNLNQSICCLFPGYKSPVKTMSNRLGLNLNFSRHTKRDENNWNNNYGKARSSMTWTVRFKSITSHVKKGSLGHSFLVTNNSSTWTAREYQKKTNRNINLNYFYISSTSNNMKKI